MCLLCSPGPVRFAEFAIVTRPAVELRGRFWEGTREAAAGVVPTLLGSVRAAAPATGGLWAGPIVSVSWNDRPDRPRVFAGVAVEEGAAPDDRLPERLFVPPLRYVTAWHEAPDGDVVARYGRMVDWIGRVGHRRDLTCLHQCEEYPRDADFRAPAELRLMLPIV